MKYMTFNSSCSYAGVANMLEQYGADTDDRSIALGMKLPYLFSYENGAYMAGPMLQSSEWFNLYLNPIGFEMTEKQVPAEQLPAYLKQQKTAMLGLQVDESGKHAVVYIGHQGGKLVFINNKWEQTNAPEQVALTEDQLLAQLGDAAMVATLKQIPPKAVDLASRMKCSVAIIRQNLADIQGVCDHAETVAQLRLKLNTLFRPLLLDTITMLQLIGEVKLAEEFTALQRSFLTALRQETDQRIILGEYISVDALTTAAEIYIELIQKEQSQQEKSDDVTV